MIDLRAGRMIPVLPVVQSTHSGSNTQVLKPVCACIAESEFLLASATSSGQTAIGIFCTGSGDPVRGTLQWSSYPRSLAVEFPYVIALLKGNVVEVHNILDQKLVQTIRFDQSMELRTLMQGSGIKVWMSTLAKVLKLETVGGGASAQGDKSLDRQETNRIATVLARILIAGKDAVSALVTTPLVLHAESLLQKGRVEEAILLSERTTATISPENLHRERLQLELDYIYQKSGLIHLGETLYEDAFDYMRRGKMDPRVVISMFPDVLQSSDILSGVHLFRGIHDQVTELGTLPNISGEVDQELRSTLLKNAKDVCLQYLTRYRIEHSGRKGHAGPQSEATDTALLGLWVDNNDNSSLLQLLESTNSCIPDLAEQKLKEANKHYALSIWYKSRKNYGATLAIWKRLLLGEIEDKSFDIGFQGVASFLSSLQDTSLVEDYGWWIVGQDESIGLKIFMPGDAKRFALFNPDQILARCKSSVSQNGLLVYLEYLVLHRKSESLEHHRMLGLIYVETLARLLADPTNQTKHQELMTGFKKAQERLVLGLDKNGQRSEGSVAEPTRGTFVSVIQANAKSDAVCSYRAKLIQILQSSALYNPSDFLPQVEAVAQLEFEKAILLSRLDKYEDCIKILVRDVKDYQGVEIFCLNAGVFRNPSRRGSKSHGSEAPPPPPPKEPLNDNEKRQKLFMLLLQEYLHMAQDQGGMTLTLRLLDSHSSFLDPSEVIPLLPSYWSVELLQRYLLRSLRRNYHEFKEIEIIKGLSLGENLKISEELFQLYESQGPVVITADAICHVCGTSVADAVFVRTADMKIIHLHCGGSLTQATE
ncbi:transforming growth factor, beta receptor associated protein 1 [Mortierella sp. GBA43]|nr:transforming growth factor, beta receptor associated protein 1 [Mortierella sp. GBA43]